ncbi:MAG TPA: phospho-N-acetylmuramoyl-pentapeptide-transferase, partial [Candidatus Limnocylindria bacterium]|nr:phospho-N-acetylmuramoyl-pentapeptide-transferase [Candidatus Limnocylindria bacterium]
MFYEFVYPLHELPGLSGLNVFRYITFRSAYAAITALLVCFALGPPMIEWLRRVKLGQKIRTEGPQAHLAKAGTPTMGGLLIVTAIVVPTLLWGNLHSRPLWLAVLATVWLGALGFLDDYLRVVKGYPKGLLGRYKLVGQIVLGGLIGTLLIVWPEPGLPATATHVPFLKFRLIDFGFLFVPFVILVVTGCSNAVNLTDGLDGLASGLVAIAALAFAGMCYLSGHIKFSEYLNISYLAYGGELTVFCMAVLGASLGFLWYNCHPADVFMGDTGSLALGGALGTVAVLIKREFWLLLVGG